jgi:hypothetical protein
MKSRKVQITVVLAVCVFVVAGIATVAARHSAAGSTRPNPPDVHRTSYVPDRSHVPAASLATASPGTALRKLAANLGAESEILSSQVESPPAPHNAQGTWLHFVVSAPANDERSIHAQWETDLVAGALADAIAYFHKAAPVTGTTIDIRLPNGTVLPRQGGGMGDIAPGQNFSHASDTAIENTINKQLLDHGLKPLRLSVDRVDQPAPDIVVQTENVDATAKAAQAIVSELFLGKDRDPLYEGYYFEVRDAANQPVFIQASSFRDGSGTLWFTPAVANVLSLTHL